MSRPIYFFDKSEDWFELSNFYPAGFTEDGVHWPTVEHYFHAQKFSGDDMAEYRSRIRNSGSPQQAKALGRTQKHAIRADWDRVRDEVMLHALRRKFEDSKVREVLLATIKRDLIENSPYDRYWGAGRDGRGKNRLGKLLMQVREELRSS